MIVRRCLFFTTIVAGCSLAVHTVQSGERSVPQQNEPVKQPTAGITEEDVSATFVEPAIGATDHANMVKMAAEPEVPRVRVPADWDRPLANVPAHLVQAAQPSYYVYDGAPVVMNLDPSQLAIRFAADAPEADAFAIAAAAGIAIADSREVGVERWRLVTLAAEATDAAQVDQLLDQLAQSPAIEFASPVFHSPAVAGGWLTITPEIMARVRMGFVEQAPAIIAHAAPELQIVRDDLGGLSGAYMLRSPSKNGYDALASANQLALDGRFAWAEPDVLATMELHLIPNDPGFDQCWGIMNTGQFGCCVDEDMDGEQAWDITRGSQSVNVLIMDTGIQQNHPDLNQTPGRDFTNGAVNGFGDGSPLGACDDHGTAVAGCVSAVINNNLGTTGIAGGANSQSARIGSQVTNPCGSVFATYSASWVVNAINWGFNNGALITNASFGVGVSNAMEDTYVDTYNNGMMHFASAGNGAVGTLSFPASANATNAVAALDPNGTLTSFSSWGVGLDFSAAGISVYTTDRTGINGYSNGDYTFAQGTSFSSPYAAGVAALFRTAFPTFSPTSVEVWLKAGAVDLGANGYDTIFGWGHINAWGSMILPGPNNNFCATATDINSYSYTPTPYAIGGATAFTGELQEPCELNNVGVSNSVWYRFVPPCDGVLNINTNGSTYDTVLSVWVGACTFAFPIACDDDGGDGLNSQLIDVAVNGGSTYFIKVADYNTTPGSGDLDFNFSFNSQPNNDFCTSATLIQTPSYNPAPICTAGALNDLCEAQESCEAGNIGVSNSVWYRFTPPCNGVLNINTAGSDYDTVLSVWTGCGFLNIQTLQCIYPTQLACDDDGGPGLTSQLTNVAVTAGQTYRIKVSDYDTTNEGGMLDFNFTFITSGAGIADINCDGVVDVLDLLAVINGWGACPVPPAACPADIFPPGGDGVVSVNDLLTVINNWS